MNWVCVGQIHRSVFMEFPIPNRCITSGKSPQRGDNRRTINIEELLHDANETTGNRLNGDENPKPPFF